MRTANRSADDLEYNILMTYRSKSGRRSKSRAVPMNEQVVTYFRKNAPLSDTQVHLIRMLELSFVFSHSKSAFMDVRPSVGKTNTMKRRRMNVLTIIERFSADLVQCSSARAV